MTAPKIVRQNPVKSFKMWKEGFSKLTPLDHALSERAGHFWGTLGATCACGSLLVQAPYNVVNGWGSFFSTFGFGMLVMGIAMIQFSAWKKDNQKIQGLEKMMESMKSQQTLNDVKQNVEAN